MANKHHYEGTGRFKSTKDVKGFAVNQHKPMLPPAMPAQPQTPPVPRASPTPKKP